MRLEFPAKIKDAAFARAEGRCEACQLPLVPGKIEYDHILPDALGGKPELVNCQCSCSACHRVKTGDDVGRIRKADRQRKAHVGARTAPVAKINSPGFAKSERTAAVEKRGSRQSLPPRPLFVDR